MPSGMYALKDNTASNNTTHGYSALLWNTTGSNNTASGYQALRSNISGLDLTAFGSAALYNNTTGCYNAALGRRVYAVIQQLATILQLVLVLCNLTLRVVVIQH